MSIRGCGNRRSVWSLVAACLVVALAVATAQTLAQSAAMTDVPKTHWAYEAVEDLVAKGYLELYPDSTFKGDEPVSRYQFAQVIHRVVEAVESGSVATTQEDVDLLRRLTTEFKDELVQLAAEMDKLDRVAPRGPERTRGAERRRQLCGRACARSGPEGGGP